MSKPFSPCAWREGGGSQSYVSKQWRQAQVDIPEVGRKGWCVCVPVAPAASFLSGSFDMHPARVMSTAEKEGKEGEEGKKKKKKKVSSPPLPPPLHA